MNHRNIHFWRISKWAACILSIIWLPMARGQVNQTVTWAGGNLYQLWDNPANWTPQFVPTNGNGTNYTVIVPSSSSISYLSGGTNTIDALSFGDSSVLDITDSNYLQVNGVSVIRGLIKADGVGSGFQAPSGNVVLEAHPMFSAKNGSTVMTGSSLFNWSQYDNDAELLLADGTGSQIDLHNISSFNVASGNGAWTYTIRATEGGLINLSGLGVINGPGSDDWLQFNLTTGGQILLDALQQCSGRVRFNIRVPSFTLPALLRANATEFLLGSNIVWNLPSLLGVQSGAISLEANSRLNGTALQSISDSSITVGSGSVIETPILNAMTNSPVSVANGGIFHAADLQTLENMSITLSGTGQFIATNLTAYRNSDIPIYPGRNVFLGLLNDVFASRIAVSGGAQFQVGATSYDCYQDWRCSPTLFSADGAGSLLDLSAMKTIQVHGGWGQTYWVSANNGGVIDLSGLETAIGARTDAYGGSDWLRFNESNGGRILLTNLKTVSRRTRFTMGDGHAFDLPQLESMSNCVFDWGFNSTINASKLTSFIDSELTLSPGRIFNVPPFTNIYSSRLAVNGGSVLHVAASSYDCYQDWRCSPTLFSADGAGSLLDLSAMKTIQVHGGWGQTYWVSANNGGVIDLSGLETAIGARTDAYGGSDWLRFNVTLGGSIRLGNTSTSRRTQFSASGSGTKLEFASLHFNSPSVLSVSDSGYLEILGDFQYENTDPNSIVVEGAYFQMDGTEPQRLELGGKNLGPSGFTSKNFGYSQLIVGETNQTSTVKLVDNFDNGQRGAGGDAEALYLYGVGGAGLRLLNGSRLILNGLDAYAFISGQMRSLNSLIPAGANSVAFDEGFLAQQGGPRITNMTPSITLQPPVSSVEVTFDIPINAATFTTDDVALTGPSGLVTINEVSPVSDNTYRISFAPQTTSGSYSVRVGPAVNELANNLSGMDQNDNGLGGEANVDAFEGTFTIDGDPPVMLTSCGLTEGTKVGVFFNEPVTPSEATNTANYLVNGVQPSNAILHSDGRSIELTVPALVGAAFSLSINGVGDLTGNYIGTALLSTNSIVPMRSVDVGAVGAAGTGFTADGSDFELNASGGDIGGSSDACHFVYEQRQGDFDVRVRLEALAPITHYTSAGLMVRESLLANAAHAYLRVFPAGTVTNAGWGSQGRNTFWPQVRSASGGNAYVVTNEISGVPYPNAWFRLSRHGDTIQMYYGTNGLDWTLLVETELDLPSNAFVGLCASSFENDSTRFATAVFRDYGDFSPSIIRQPQDQSVASGSDAVFGVEARGITPLSYQWNFNGVPLANATNASLILSNVQVSQVGDYTVSVSNIAGSVTSALASLIVDGLGTGGLEGDVSPPPLGDGVLSMQDWVKTGLFVTGLETPINSSQFQKADCAPAPCGDGRLTVADWTQTGLYAAGLVDPIPQACGDKTPVGMVAPRNHPGIGLLSSESRILRVRENARVAGQPVELCIEMEIQGNENAIGFSIQFDSAAMQYVNSVASANLGNVTVQINDRQAALGRIGFAMAQPVGTSMPRGSQELLRLRFQPLGMRDACAVNFVDRPVVREVVDAAAHVQMAMYAGITIRLPVAARCTQLSPMNGGTFEAAFSVAEGTYWVIERKFLFPGLVILPVTCSF